MTCDKLKVVAVHAAPVFMDASASADKAVLLVEKAAASGADLVVFPETFIPGFPIFINAYPPPAQAALIRKYQDQSVARDGEEMSKVQHAAKRCRIAVIIGISERPQSGRTCYNASVAYDKDGTLLGVHRKILPTFAERYVWGQGDGSGLLAWNSSIGQLGSLICWEHTMNLARQAIAEQNVTIHAAHWPALSTIAGFEAVANSQIQAMMLNHALTAQCFVICASSPTAPEAIEYMEAELGPQQVVKPGGGWTAIIHPFTPIVAGPETGPDDALVMADIDVGCVKDTKVWLDTAGHFARPDIFKLVVDTACKRCTTFEASRTAVDGKSS